MVIDLEGSREGVGGKGGARGALGVRERGS